MCELLKKMRFLIALAVIISSCSNSNDPASNNSNPIDTVESTSESSFDSTAVLYNGKGTLFFAEGDVDSALYYYNLSIQLDSSYHSPHSNKCQLFLKSKNYQSALSESKVVLIKNPGLAEAWAFTGMLYDFLSDSINARTHYLRSIEIFDNRIANTEDENFSRANRLNRAVSLLLLGNETEAHAELIDLKNTAPNDSEVMMIEGLLNFNKEEYLNEVIKG